MEVDGGYVLVYDLQEQRPQNPQDMEKAVEQRLRQFHFRGATARMQADDRLKVAAPGVEEAGLKRLRLAIESAGLLEFRIVANQRQHPEWIALAKAPQNNGAAYITDDQGEQVAMWARVARDTDENSKVNGIFPLKVDAWDFAAVRDAQTFEILDIRPAAQQQLGQETLRFEGYLAREGIEEIDVLMATDDGFDIKGSDLSRAALGYDGNSPIVEFTLKSGKDLLFGALTDGNLPDTRTGSYSQMGILLDGKLLSAPRIMSRIDKRGQITGRFTREEVQFLVDILRAGRLPASINRDTVQINRVAPKR